MRLLSSVDQFQGFLSSMNFQIEHVIRFYQLSETLMIG